jgi:hypothetical protein
VDFIAELVDLTLTKFVYILFKTRVIKEIWKRTSADRRCIGADRGVAAVCCGSGRGEVVSDPSVAIAIVFGLNSRSFVRLHTAFRWTGFISHYSDDE